MRKTFRHCEPRQHLAGAKQSRNYIGIASFARGSGPACGLLAMTLCLLSLATPTFASETDSIAAAKFYKSGQQYESKEKFGRAVNAYYHAILMDADYAKAFRAIGRVYVRKGLYKDALDNLKEALFLDKYDPETHYYLGVVYPIVEHDSANALEHYQEFLKLSPGESKKTQQARKWIEKLERMGNVTHDQELIVTYNAGAELSQQGKHVEAAGKFRAAIEMNSHYAPAHLELGRSLLSLKKFEAALKEFEEVLLIDPANAEAHYGLGVAYPIARGDEAKGIDHYQHYLELNPKAKDAAQVQKWIAKLQEALDAKKEEVQWYNQGVDLSEKGQHQDAVEAFRKALEINSDYPDALYALGLSLVQLQEYEEARKSFEEALEINPNFAEAHYGLGVVCPLLGEKVAAVTHFWKYLELKPNAPDIKQVIEWIDKLEQET